MESTLVQQVGEWATANFDVTEPWLGLVEETGEAAHCILKRKQNIRGFDDFVFFHNELFDAIGDIGIYACHFAYENKLDFTFDTVKPSHYEPVLTESYLISLMMYHLSQLGFEDSSHNYRAGQFSSFLTATHFLADYTILADLLNATQTTWEKIVSKRNWRVNPKSANVIDPV